MAEVAVEPRPKLVFPDLNAAPASWLTSEVTAAGKHCLVAMCAARDPNTSKRNDVALKEIELDSGNVSSSTILKDASWVSFSRGGGCCTYRIGTPGSKQLEDCLVVMQLPSGKIKHRVNLNEFALEKEVSKDRQLVVLDDLTSLTVAGSRESPYALARISLEKKPRITASLPKGPYRNASTFKVSYGKPDGRVAAILIPKKHQQRWWKCLLMDMEFKVLTKLDVPVKSHALEMYSGNSPMFLIANGPRWMLFSLSSDKFTLVSGGIHGSPSGAQSAIWSGAISPDGRWLATTSMAHVNSLAIWSTSTGTMVSQIPLDGFGIVHFDISGRFLSCNVQRQGMHRLVVWDFPVLVSAQREVQSDSLGRSHRRWENKGR
jgi:hypothetical protein